MFKASGYGVTVTGHLEGVVIKVI